MYLVTGAAGFIGMHISKYFLERGNEVIGIDNINDYYDINLKIARLEEINGYDNFHFQQGDISDNSFVQSVFKNFTPEIVINLAAQAGVRYSIENPYSYIKSNITGFSNILESCRHHAIKHLVYASSSSVYGANKNIPFSENDNVDHPVSLYAATKKSNELMAHTYSHLFGLRTTGLRFFTVYGPWGRPDMSPWLFTKAIIEDKPIRIFNYGKMQRDFTYIDDIVEGAINVLDTPSSNNYSTPTGAPYEIYNIGGNQPIPLLDYVQAIENAIGKPAIKEFLPMQPGDMETTYANIDKLQSATNYLPKTNLSQGINSWVKWYCNYHKLSL